MTGAAAQAGHDRNRAWPVAAGHDRAEWDKGLAQQEGRTVRLPRMIEPHGGAGRLGRATRRQRVVDDGEAPRPVGFAPDDAAPRGHQAKQAKPTSLKHPVVGLPTQPWCQRQDGPRDLPAWASTAPIISSAMVLRAGPGTDSTISRTHADSVGGKPVSSCGSMAPSSVWADTHNAEPGDWRRLPEPVRRLRAGAD